MDDNAGIIAITTISLLGISGIELMLQRLLCHSVKQYLFSIFFIIIINTTLTGLALMLTYNSSVGVTAIFYLSASMAFPLFAGLMRVVDITAEESLRWDANDFLNRRKNNNAR